MNARLVHILRYPVKSIGGEALDRVALTAGQPLPGDRRYGVMHQGALHHLDGGALLKWLPKSAFLRGAAAAPLQAIRGGWDGEALLLTHPDLAPLRFDPAGDDGPLLDWLAPLWAGSGKAPPARLVQGPQALTDVKQPFVSILSLTSLAAVEDRLGRPLGVPRWRGNLWVDGWPAFHERDLRLRRLRIGEVEVKVQRFIGRCPATNADTDTGRPDGDTPAELEREYGHQDFGVYAEVLRGGTIHLGDPVVTL